MIADGTDADRAGTKLGGKPIDACQLHLHAGAASDDLGPVQVLGDANRPHGHRE